MKGRDTYSHNWNVKTVCDKTKIGKYFVIINLIPNDEINHYHLKKSYYVQSTSIYTKSVTLCTVPCCRIYGAYFAHNIFKSVAEFQYSRGKVYPYITGLAHRLLTAWICCNLALSHRLSHFNQNQSLCYISDTWFHLHVCHNYETVAWRRHLSRKRMQLYRNGYPWRLQSSAGKRLRTYGWIQYVNSNAFDNFKRALSGVLRCGGL